MNNTSNRTNFDIFHEEIIECRPAEFLPDQKEVISCSNIVENILNADDITFRKHLKTVTERKKKLKNSGTLSRKNRSLEKLDDIIKFPPYKVKPHFIPTEVQLSLFKASVIGRNDAEKIIKKSGITKCTTSVLSSGKLKEQNKNKTPNKRSTLSKKTLFGDIACPNNISLTPENAVVNIDIDSVGTENCSATGFQLCLNENSTENDIINLELLQTPKMDNTGIKTMAPLSGIRKLADSPITSSPSTPTLRRLIAKDITSSLDNISCAQLLSKVILNGIVAFVDVRSDSENHSQGVKDVLLSLGAKVENYFTRKVTVVVFKDGLMSTYKRARLWNVPMVSILWIEACKEELEIVPVGLHPPLNLDKYESTLILNLGTKKKIRKKIREEVRNSPRQPRNRRVEELQKPSELEKLMEAPKTPSHEDGFIQALLAVAGDELKDFLNRPLRQPIDEDSHVDLPLSVRLLHKHVFERRARTSIKESTGSFEENIRKLSDNGRIKLRKLVFPSCSEEEDKATEKREEINNCAFEKDANDIFKKPENTNSINIFDIAKHGFDNDRRSAPAILFRGKSRRSAPAKLITRRKLCKKQLGFEDGNIVKYFVRTAGIENSVKNVTCESSDMLPKNKKNTMEKDVPLDIDKNVDKVVIDSEDNSMTTLTQSPSENVLTSIEDTLVKRKRKLLPLGSNIYLTEPVCTSCEPSPIVCPYIKSPQKKKHITNLGNYSTSKAFLKPVLPKKKLKETLSSPSSDSEISCSSRRGSSILFIDAKEKKIELQRVTPTIVCTSIHRKDIDAILAMVNELGKFSLDRTVNERTTHVVTCASRRTINLLKGIARGAWILKDEWIYKSFVAGKWLNEEPFELVEFSPAVKQSRIERLAFGPEFSLELFKNLGFIYVCKGTNPPSADLVELLRICGGKVVTNARIADIIVGSKTKQTDNNVISVTEKWVLDSITLNKKLNPELYGQTD